MRAAAPGMIRRMHRLLALLIGAGRAALGIALVAKPELVARGWLGEEANNPVPRALITGLGVRDAVLGLVQVSTGGRGRGAALMLLGGAAADAADLAGTVRAGNAVPIRGRAITIALAGGSVLASLWTAPKVARRKHVPIDDE